MRPGCSASAHPRRPFQTTAAPLPPARTRAPTGRAGQTGRPAHGCQQGRLARRRRQDRVPRGCPAGRGRRSGLPPRAGRQTARLDPHALLKPLTSGAAACGTAQSRPSQGAPLSSSTLPSASWRGIASECAPRSCRSDAVKERWAKPVSTYVNWRSVRNCCAGELESLQAHLDETQLHMHGHGMPARFPSGLVLWLTAEKRRHLG